MTTMKDDWSRVGEAVASRLRAMGSPSLRQMDRTSKVSTETWRNLLDGQPLKRTDKIAQAEEALGWEYGSIEAILAGGEPTVADVVARADTVTGGVSFAASELERLSAVEAELAAIRREVAGVVAEVQALRTRVD